jgi:transcriptional regulator with XRE-family HTH domain
VRVNPTYCPMLWRVRRLAAERGWTMTRLARRAGLLPQNLTRWARGWPWRSTQLDAKVARALGLTVAALVTGVADEQPGAYDAAQAVARSAATPAAAIDALTHLDLDWPALVALAADWRTFAEVRAWARTQQQRYVRRHRAP